VWDCRKTLGGKNAETKKKEVLSLKIDQEILRRKMHIDLGYFEVYWAEGGR